ncbi:MAG TPA: RNA-processing protein [Candidatus Altiarchaeales archaeon]|nr:RNA-processing protein [Candidatus Altiarchaeales archaeon]
MQSIQIPEERVAVLLGEKGATKRRIEKETKTKITVEEGFVEAVGDPIGEMTAIGVIHAIGRGFSPHNALRLLNEDNTLILISVTDFANTKSSLERLRGRVIGEDGKTRKTIENMTRTRISVYGKTVGVIGSYENVEEARNAIEMLLSGSKHTTVYRNLELMETAGKKA